MPADYQMIREENIQRYGWDTAVLDLLGQLYSDRTHFIFELIQNAEDAGASELAFELFGDRLEVRHDGRPFTEADVRGVCGVGQSGKPGDLTTIGKFGIGFKSVYAYTRSPRVHSAGLGEHFRIESFVRPFAIDPGEGDRDGDSRNDGERGGRTLFVFPFDHDEVSAETAVAEISSALTGLDLTTLLFLRNIESVRTGGVRTADQVLRRVTAERTGFSRRVVLTRRGERNRDRDRADAEWWVWQRGLDALGRPELRVETALRVEHQDGGPRLVGTRPAPLVVFFPTEKETFTGCLMQGPYRTTPARDNVPEHDDWNRDLAGETGTLLAGLLTELRDEGLLTAGVLAAMPLDPARFPPGSLLRPLFESVRAALATDALIPVAGGGYGAARDLRLAHGDGLRELLSDEQLGEVCRAGGPIGWVDASLTAGGTTAGTAAVSGSAFSGPVFSGPPVVGPTVGGRESGAVGPGVVGPTVGERESAELAAALGRYLRQEVGVQAVTPDGLTSALTAEFLAAQPDEWIADLYAFLLRHRDLWQEPESPARRAPIVRLEDGRQVAPFGTDGRPAAYLPTAGPSSADLYGADPSGAGPSGAGVVVGQGLATVRRAVAGTPGARELLEALGFTEPDVVSEVLDGVLPRYDGLDAADLDPVQHDADLECVVRALAEAPAARRDELLTRLRRTTFLVGQNAATGERRLMTPPGLYQRTKDLETYFDGNPEAWFADDTYGPWRTQLRGMGVREEVGLRARKPDESGNVVVAADFARHERGLDGFDPEAEFDGLEFALGHPDAARSEYVWNTLLVPHRRLLAGVVEKAARQGYQDARREHVTSVAGAVAVASAWLPGPDGTFRRPAELQLDDLPVTFERDEGLAAALGLVQASVEAASRQLGIPADVLRGLGQHPDLVEMVEQELKNRGWGGHR
ncbi:MAG TPA: hypothetical protein VHY58_20440 [Streptosporangiaceae bacterium]|nr:hypothetical protein [Streptosporangiaceae bacterium]